MTLRITGKMRWALLIVSMGISLPISGAAVGEQERNLIEQSSIMQPAESKGGALAAGDPVGDLTDGNPDTAVTWSGGVDGFPAIIDFEFGRPLPVDTVVCRWKSMPSDYVLQGWMDQKWKTLASVTKNIVLGPKIELHMFSPVPISRLRLRVTGTVTNDCHGRGEGLTNACALSDIGVYSPGELPAYMEEFLTRDTPRLAASRKYIEELNRQEPYTPDPSWLTAEIPVWRPISRRQYKDGTTGKKINEKSMLLGDLLRNCAWAYARTGDERYAGKTRDVLLAIFDHYEEYQAFRFFGIGWKAITFQEPAYMMHGMNTAYDLVASSPCMTREDKLRFIFFSLNNAEFQYRAIRDRFNGGENWSANSVGELALTAYYFRGFPETTRWITIADEKIGGCIRPFLADGYWRECSPSHMVYMLRGICKYGIAKDLVGDPVWTKKLGGKSIVYLLESLGKTMNPFGEIPSINDSSDNDRHLLTSREGLREALYLIGRGDLLEMFKDFGPPPFIPGRERRPIAKETPAFTSVLLPDAGIAVMRDGWKRDDSYLLLDYGPHGGPHGQRDKLSFIMFSNGHHWIPDAGDAPHYVIFPEQKTWHKQTVAHNTILINNKSQDMCEGKLVFWEADDALDIVSALHSEGYPGFVHRRTIVHPHSEYFIIHDVVTSDEGKQADLDWLLHVYGNLESQEKNQLCFRTETNSANALLILSEDITDETLKIDEGLCGGLERDKWTGPGYPAKGQPGWIYIPYIRLHKLLTPEDTQVEYFVVLFPFVGERPPVEIRVVRDRAGNASGIQLRYGDREDLFVEAASDYQSEKDGAYQCGEVAGTSKFIFLRKQNEETILKKEYP